MPPLPSDPFLVSIPGVRIRFAPGALAHAGDEVARLGKSRALVVCGNSIASKTPALTTLKRALGSKYAGDFTGVTYNLDHRASARDALAQLITDTRADLLISVGGGIAIGAARAGRTKYLSSHPGHDLPMITVPTTLSAAEANAAYVSLPGHERRVPEPGSRPAVAILDPELAAHTPWELFCSSGFNAINHCIEGLSTTARHPVADAFYLHALHLVASNLEDSKDQDNIHARGQALIGGYLSGLMIESTWLGIAHALCHGLQATFGSPHGLNNTVMVTQGMKYNMQHAVQYIAMAAQPLGVVAGDDDYVTTQRCIKAVEDLRASLGLPSRLRDIPGITPDGFPKAAGIAFHDFFTPYNRRQPESPEELVALYHQAW